MTTISKKMTFHIKKEIFLRKGIQLVNNRTAGVCWYKTVLMYVCRINTKFETPGDNLAISTIPTSLLIIISAIVIILSHYLINNGKKDK